MMLEPDPSKRSLASQVFCHPLFTSGTSHSDQLMQEMEAGYSNPSSEGKHKAPGDVMKVSTGGASPKAEFRKAHH